jgi:hypothetical protein
MKRSLPLLALLAAGACLPLTKSVGEATETETEGSTDGGSLTGTVPSGTDATSIEPPSSSESTTTTTGNPSDVTTDDTSATGDPPSFACPPEPGEQQCDPVVQDCPGGFHCVPWSDDDGGVDDHDAFVCAPLANDPAGRHEACTADPATCGDDCDVGTYCLPEYAPGLGGLCLGTCSSDGNDETCAAGEVCVTCGSCSVGTCLPSCDPLDPQCPEGAGTCLFSVSDDFVCAPAVLGEAGFGEVCEFPQECAENLLCVEGSVFGAACGGPGCCTELCDLVDGDPGCSDPGHVCISFYLPGTAPEGLDHVGLCAVPEADPCAVPGSCPPPGIDDTYPWCSVDVSEYCPDGDLAGFGNGPACEGTCLCQAPCVDDGDCSLPPTGTAVPECVEEPYGPGSPTTCLLRCDGGETCPDGMTCTDELWGDSVCAWLSPLPPDQC